VLNGSVDALDADAGCLIMRAPPAAPIGKTCGERALERLLELAGSAARSSGQPSQVEVDGAWALAIPLRFGSDNRGVLTVARRTSAFREDEQALMMGLVERAQTAATEIVAHDVLREQAQTDPLTRLGNRRKLAEELGDRLVKASPEAPLVLMLFDLDGFKAYNDTFGHVAGDALLARLGCKLDTAVAPTARPIAWAAMSSA
jgi:predicted signal transduction protein with EAL and GGDEF domain